jgi:hypothetical protein
MTPRDPYLETRYVDPGDLYPYPGNPNAGDVDEIRGSVRRNGQYRPVITRPRPDGALEILAGHATTEATGAEVGRVRVEVIDVDDATAARIVAADNAIPRKAAVDEAALLALLDAASADGGLAGTGYVEEDLDDLRALLEETAPPPAPLDASREQGGRYDGTGVYHQGGMAELIDSYKAAPGRFIVLNYEGARYVWVVETLAALAEEFDVDSNADVLLRLLEEHTGETAPDPEGRGDCSSRR